GGGLVDARGGAPGELPAAERAAADRDRVRRRRAVEAEAGVVDVSLAVERDGRIAARVVLAADQVLDAGDQRADVAGIGRVAAPGLAAVVREVRPRVGVPERAARGAADRAGPRAGHVVVLRADHP